MPNAPSNSDPSILSPSLADWYQRGEHRTIQGHNIFVIDEGEKNLPVIVLIHGFPTSSWDWKTIWETLRKSYRLVSIDMLGFGFSDKPDYRGYTIHAQADLFDIIIKDLEIKQFHLLAHDYGNSVAQELLARQIERHSENTPCKSCCFLNGGLFPETHKALLIQKILLSPLGKWVNRHTGFKQFSASFSRVFGESSKPSQTELEEFWELINFNNGKHLFHNLITYMNDRIQHRERWVAALINAPMPMGLINGSVDPVSGKHLVIRYQELACRLDYLKELPLIGHYPQVEAPNIVSDAYLAFLNQVPSSS